MSATARKLGPRMAQLIAENRAAIDAASNLDAASDLVKHWARVVASTVADGERPAAANLDAYVYAEARLKAMCEELSEASA